MSKTRLKRILSVKGSIFALIMFIVIEKIIESGVIVPILVRSSLSEIMSNIAYKAVEIALVIGLNRLLVREKMYFRVKLSIGLVIFFLISVLYLSLLMNAGPQQYLFEVLLWTSLTAVSEELLFRGVILGSLLKIFIKKFSQKRMSVILAVLVASLVFSLEHLSNLANQSLGVTICQLIQTFGMGVLLAAFYIKTGSLLSSIYLHFLIDFPGLYFSQLQLSQGALNLKASVIGSIVIAVIYVIVSLLMTRAFNKNNRLIKFNYESLVLDRLDD